MNMQEFGFINNSTEPCTARVADKYPHRPWYRTWRHMIERAYDTTYHAKHPTYLGCSVDAAWKEAETFRLWFHDNYIHSWYLDKDLLVAGNKLYSPERCVFVPARLNSVLSTHTVKGKKLPQGVSYRTGPEGRHYRAQIKDGTKTVQIGTYTDPNDALYAYTCRKLVIVSQVLAEHRELLDGRVNYSLLRKHVLTAHRKGSVLLRHE